MKKLFVMVLLLAHGAAFALPVNWVLNNVVLEHQDSLGGSTEIRHFNVTGSFVYDADTNEYSEISVTTDPSSFPPLTSEVWPGITYTGENYHYGGFNHPAYGYSGPLTSADSEGMTLAASFYHGALFWLQNGLRLSYESSLSNAGGIVALALDGASFERLNAEVAGSGLDHRYIVSGSLHGTVVPIPPVQTTAVITFNDVTSVEACPGGPPDWYRSFESEGFRFDALEYCIAAWGQLVMDTIHFHGHVEMTPTSGESFTLVSFEYDFAPISVVGFYADGSTVGINLPGIFDESGAVSVVLDPAWQGLEKVEFSAPAGAHLYSLVDNIVVDFPDAVEIDVDPWSTANEVDPASNKQIHVLVKGSNTATGDATDFDVYQIDPDSLRFGAGEASNLSGYPLYADPDNDTNMDALFAFNTQDTGILCADPDVSLLGETFSGDPFAGADTIDTTGCDTGGCHP